MQYLERLECGLPAGDFLQNNLGRSRISSTRTTLPPAAGHRTRFGSGSPWHANRAAGEALTWRGRNFITGFAELNSCDLVQATMLELPAGACRIAVENWKSTLPDVEHYHLICEASAGSRMRVGECVVTLRAGDLWRVHGSDLPVIVQGGCEGGIQVALALARRHAGSSSEIMANERKISEAPE